MKTLFQITLLSFLFTNIAFAQKVAKEKKYEKIIYNELTQDNENMTIYAVDAVSTESYFKFKLRILNKTKDYLVIDFNKMKIIINGSTEYKPTEKALIIPPGEFGTRVVNFTGSEFRITQLDIFMDGVKTASTNGKVYEAPNYNLPVSNNDFTTGPFKLLNKGTESKTDITLVKMEVTYTGSDIAVIQPIKIGLKMPVSGTVFANMISSKKAILLGPNESANFNMVWENIDAKQNGDMQKVKMEILFKDAFMETKTEDKSGTKFTLTINEKESK